MRLWSVSPDQLDRAALVAGWREGLLAQKVLLGHTKGYRAHPQLQRFRALGDPIAGITTWLHGLADAADARGYRFDRSRVVLLADPTLRMELTDGQLSYEWAHLSAKVAARDPAWAATLVGVSARAHPVFDVRPGPIADWERPH
ncbi:pyrimidine dimer DNA glycosylase/endonuclease V [Austwickia chelonae]|uniref:pyrimidine dimer DNA glycosylase/endonuclease V n=1 Tax=Austwickia chelonae TaxID=100225 RepID=UPI000E2761BE|nr:pyrimidine dimer DNA glycosylase/endonuclease V [Austwickia chelonae]